MSLMTKGNLNNKNYLHIFQVWATVQKKRNEKYTRIFVETSGVQIVRGIMNR
jgi:hypothetical protein